VKLAEPIVELHTLNFIEELSSEEKGRWLIKECGVDDDEEQNGDLFKNR
jgi:hypothetical protein